MKPTVWIGFIENSQDFPNTFENSKVWKIYIIFRFDVNFLLSDNNFIHSIVAEWEDEIFRLSDSLLGVEMR